MLCGRSSPRAPSQASSGPSQPQALKSTRPRASKLTPSASKRTRWSAAPFTQQGVYGPDETFESALLGQTVTLAPVFPQA